MKLNILCNVVQLRRWSSKFRECNGSSFLGESWYMTYVQWSVDANPYSTIVPTLPIYTGWAPSCLFTRQRYYNFRHVLRKLRLYMTYVLYLADGNNWITGWNTSSLAGVHPHCRHRRRSPEGVWSAVRISGRFPHSITSVILPSRFHAALSVLMKTFVGVHRHAALRKS